VLLHTNNKTYIQTHHLFQYICYPICLHKYQMLKKAPWKRKLWTKVLYYFFNNYFMLILQYIMAPWFFPFLKKCHFLTFSDVWHRSPTHVFGKSTPFYFLVEINLFRMHKMGYFWLDGYSMDTPRKSPQSPHDYLE